MTIRRLPICIALLCLTGASGILAAGCQQEQADKIPTKEERLKAIENNPKYTEEDKARYKEQMEKGEKYAEMGRQMFAGMKPPTPAPPTETVGRLWAYDGWSP